MAPRRAGKRSGVAGKVVEQLLALTLGNAIRERAQDGACGGNRLAFRRAPVARRLDQCTPRVGRLLGLYGATR